MAKRTDLIVIHNTITDNEMTCVDEKQARVYLKRADKGWKAGPLPATKKGGDS